MLQQQRQLLLRLQWKRVNDDYDGEDVEEGDGDDDDEDDEDDPVIRTLGQLQQQQ